MSSPHCKYFTCGDVNHRFECVSMARPKSLGLAEIFQKLSSSRFRFGTSHKFQRRIHQKPPNFKVDASCFAGDYGHCRRLLHFTVGALYIAGDHCISLLAHGISLETTVFKLRRILLGWRPSQLLETIAIRRRPLHCTVDAPHFT